MSLREQKPILKIAVFSDGHFTVNGDAQSAESDSLRCSGCGHRDADAYMFLAGRSVHWTSQ
jgi:hypothetical protein